MDEVVDDAAGVEGGEDDHEEESDQSNDLPVKGLRRLSRCPRVKKLQAFWFTSLGTHKFIAESTFPPRLQNLGYFHCTAAAVVVV